jgi:hypothetical protein
MKCVICGKKLKGKQKKVCGLSCKNKRALCNPKKRLKHNLYMKKYREINGHAPKRYQKKFNNEFCLCGCGEKLPKGKTKFINDKHCARFHSRVRSEITYKSYNLKDREIKVDSKCLGCGAHHRGTKKYEYCPDCVWKREYSDYSESYSLRA